MKIIALAIGMIYIGFVASGATACPACEGNTSVTSETAQEIQTLTPVQVHAQLTSGRISVFDANPLDVFIKHHVAGALHVEYDQVKAADLPADKSWAIVFYCMNERCGASPMAAKRAVELGHTNVYLMPAGIEGWIRADLKTTRAVR